MKLPEVFAGLKTYWDMDTGLDTVVPGGLHFERPQQTATIPYAVMTGTEEQAELFTGTTGIQWFGLTFSVWSTAGATDASDIQRRIAELFKRANRTLIHIGNATVLDLQPAPSEFTQEDTADAKEVVVARSSFRLLLQLEY